MKILLVCYEFPPVGGGGSRVVAGLAGELAAQGHAVDVLTMAWYDRSQADCPTGVRLIEIPCTRRRVGSTSALELGLYLPGLVLALTAALKRGDYDVCNVHFLLPDGLAAAIVRLFLGRHFVVTAHGSDVPGYNPDRFTWLHRLIKPVWRRVARAADVVVCPSATLQQLVAAQAPGVRTVVIPNGFDETRISPDRPKKRRILVVSRLFRRKGVATLIEAFLNLDTDFELHVVGDGPDYETITKLAAGHPSIILHGWLENASPALTELLETSAIFAFISKAENFPVCLLEAMAAGMAIVTSEKTGCADAVGDTGILVAAGDVSAMQAALERLISDPGLVASMGACSRERLEQYFSWRVVTASYLNLYRQSTLENGPPLQNAIEGQPKALPKPDSQ